MMAKIIFVPDVEKAPLINCDNENHIYEKNDVEEEVLTSSVQGSNFLTGSDNSPHSFRKIFF